MTKQEQSFLMAKRLKGLREEKGLSHVGLKNALYEQYGIQISRDSLMSYEIQSEYHSKIKGGKYPNLNMGVEYLNAFAKFYGVSSDYLLGLSDKPTLDPYAAGASEYTGLSLEAVQALKGLKGMSVLKETLSYFVSSERFKQIAIDLFHYRERIKEAVDLAENPAAEYGDIQSKIVNAQMMEYYASKNLSLLFSEVEKEELSKIEAITKLPDGEGYKWQKVISGNREV